MKFQMLSDKADGDILSLKVFYNLQFIWRKVGWLVVLQENNILKLFSVLPKRHLMALSQEGINKANELQIQMIWLPKMILNITSHLYCLHNAVYGWRDKILANELPWWIILLINNKDVLLIRSNISQLLSKLLFPHNSLKHISIQ